MSSTDVPGHRALFLPRADAEAESGAAARPLDDGRAPSPLSLRTLFEQHHGSVWRLLKRFGVPVAHLDDAAQEVFWVAARRLADIKPGSEKAFLYGVALRIAADHARRRQHAPRMAEPEELSRLVDPAPSPEQCLENRRARELLDVVLDQLPLELRTVLVLAELEGLEVRDIAALEGIPPGTASSRLRRAREEFAAVSRRVRASLTARGVTR